MVGVVKLFIMAVISYYSNKIMIAFIHRINFFMTSGIGNSIMF
jgi:hypothetical protein